MATYSGDLTTTSVAANYLVSQPSTQFGTRQLSVLQIAASGIDTNYADANSFFSKTIRALQQTAEVWSVFTPTSGAVKVIISADTQWTGTGAPAAGTPAGQLTDSTYTALEAALQAGTDGSTTFTVTVPAGFVAPFHG
jgi:hypothetical protein